MPGSFTNAFEDIVLNHIFRGQNQAFFTNTSPLYVSLYTVAPDESTAGTEVSTSSTGYARKSIDVSAASSIFSVSSDGATSNTSAITFNTATASWGTIVALGITTAATGGTLIAYSTLSTSKAIGVGDTATIAIGDLDITLN